MINQVNDWTQKKGFAIDIAKGKQLEIKFRFISNTVERYGTKKSYVRLLTKDHPFCNLTKFGALGCVIVYSTKH